MEGKVYWLDSCELSGDRWCVVLPDVLPDARTDCGDLIHEVWLERVFSRYSERIYLIDNFVCSLPTLSVVNVLFFNVLTVSRSLSFWISPRRWYWYLHRHFGHPLSVFRQVLGTGRDIIAPSQ